MRNKLMEIYNNRLGVIEIEESCYIEHDREILKVFTPLSIETIRSAVVGSLVLKIFGYSRLFQELKPGERIPTYWLKMHTSEWDKTTVVKAIQQGRGG